MMLGRTSHHQAKDVNDVTTRAIINSTESSEILNLISTHKKLKRAEPAHLIQIINNLVHVHYVKLARDVTWLSDTRGIAFVQMAMNDSAQDFLAPLFNHSSVQKLLDTVIQNLGSFSADEVAAALNGFLFLGIDALDPRFNRLVEECQTKISELSSAGFCDISVVHSSIKPRV